MNGISLVGVSQKLAAEALSSCAINPDTGVVNFVLAREKEQVEELANRNLSPEQPNLAPVDPNSASMDPSLKPEPSEAVADTSSSPSSPTLSESLTEESLEPSAPLEPPVSLILTPASLSGESKVFIPVPAPAPPPISLSELPPDLILRIARLLCPKDRSRLRTVNKSFSAALTNAGPVVLTNDGPAISSGGQTAPSSCGDQNFPPKKENPPPDQSKNPPKNCENRRNGSEPLPGKLKTPPNKMKTVGDVSPLRTSSAEARRQRDGVNRNMVPLLSSLS